MTLIVLSLGSAVMYGAADFFGGAASRRASARSVLLVSLPIGLAVVVVAALVTGTAVSQRGLAWGAAGGLAGGTGLLVFYGALARGPMSVVAPIAALVSALLPVGAGLLRGERPAPSALVGVLVCLIAICLVSMEEPRARAAGAVNAAGPRARPVRGPVLAALAGACFGIFFVLLREGGRDGGLWAPVASRAAGLLVVAAVALAGWALSRRRARPGRPGSGDPGFDRPGSGSPGPAPAADPSPPEGRVRVIPADRAALLIAVLAGALDSLANVSYVLATRTGMLSLAAVLTSLYPAITVLLARVVYSERLRAMQRFGVVLALVGVALVTAG